MVKVSQWVFMLMGLVVVPLIKGLIPSLKVEAAKTETDIDDALVGAFEIVVTALESGLIFVPKSTSALGSGPGGVTTWSDVGRVKK